VKAALPQASERRICRVLEVSRSGSRTALKGRPGPGGRTVELEARLRALIQIYPTFGYRRLWAILRFKEACRVGRNTVYRLLKKNGWLVTNRLKSAKP
jgi:putative transposase